MPWVGRYSLGDSTKVLCFFGAELYKITERCRGRRWFFALGGQVFVGRWHKSTVFFWREIIQNYGVLPGEGAVFCPGWAGICWGIAQKRYAFSMRNYIKLRSIAGEGGDFSPGNRPKSPGFRPKLPKNTPLSPGFRPVLLDFCPMFC